MERREFLLGTTTLATLAAIGCTPTNVFSYASPSPVWWNAAPWVASEQGFYEKVNLNIRDFNVATGTRSKEAVATNNAHSGVAAPNSFSLASQADLNQLVILSNTMQSNTTVSIVSRSESIDWSTARIGVVKGTIAEFYLISHLRKLGENYLNLYIENKLNLVSQSPAGVAASYQGGEIDVAVIWEPFASQISNSAGNFVIRDDSLYSQQIYLLTSVNAYESKRADMEKMNQALQLACNYIHNNRDLVAKQLENFFKFEDGFLSKSDAWNGTKFPFSKSKSDMAGVLKQDFEIAKIAGLNKVDSIEDFIPNITRFLD